MKHFQVKNWAEFQHYKKRNPPWIKLHRSVLDNPDFSCLQDASKLHLILIWLLASQTGNKLPYDEGWLTKKLMLQKKILLQPLIDNGFIECVPVVLADCKHDASNLLLSEEKRRDREETDTEAAVGSTPLPPVENKNTPKTGKEPKNNPTLSDLAAQVQSCRPEFARLNTDSILNLLRNVPLPIARRAVAEFCRDELNALKVPDRPLKLLGGYIRTARTAPQFTGAHNVSYDVQRQNDIRLARQEYEAMKNPYGRTPDQAKTDQARIVSAIAAKYGPAAAAAVRQ